MHKLIIYTAGKHIADISTLREKYERQLRPFAHVSWKLAHDEVALEKMLPERYVVLDERGRDITSRDIAATLQRHMNSSTETALVIGGAYGLSDATRAKAEEVWAFGKITLPHQLMRVLLLEQLYRGFAILSNHPYHHDG